MLNYLAIPDGTNGGIEQPIWDPVTRKFYLNVPSSNSNPLGGDLYHIDGPTGEDNSRLSWPARWPWVDPVPRLSSDVELPRCLRSENWRHFGGARHAKRRHNNGICWQPIADEVWYNSGDDRVYYRKQYGDPWSHVFFPITNRRYLKTPKRMMNLLRRRWRKARRKEPKNSHRA